MIQRVSWDARWAVPCLLMALVGCSATGDQAIVAKAAGYELSVNEAVSLLAGETQIPNQPEYVRALAELWVDHILLAEVARQDSTMRTADLDPLVDQQVKARSVTALRDMVIQVDTVIGDQELLEIFQAESPGVRVRARHILMGFPSTAPQARRDSVRAVLEGIRARIIAGESFEDLAQQYSHDAGSAAEGGDLGFFNRGEMVQAFDDVAFSLAEGELSEVVETAFGFHLIRVEQRQDPVFEDMKEEFRRQTQQRRLAVAESTFIAGIEANVDVRFEDDAGPLARRMAMDAGMTLGSRTARRALAQFDGGSVTLGEVQEFMQIQDPQIRQQILTLPDDRIEAELIQGLVQRQLLLREAEERGVEVPEAARDSIRENLRGRFVEMARSQGLLNLPASPSQSGRDLVESTVGRHLSDILNGTRGVTPMGGIAFALRRQFRPEILQSGIDFTVTRIGEARGPQPPPTTAPPPPTPPVTAPPDTSGEARRP